MMLLLHISIALSSMAIATYAVIKPTQISLRVSQSLVILTVITGTYLSVSHPAHLLQTCVAGLAYISFSLVALLVSRRKLARIEI